MREIVPTTRHPPGPFPGINARRSSDFLETLAGPRVPSGMVAFRAMGVSLRIFIVEDGGSLRRVPMALFSRWYDGESLPASYAGLELKILDVAVEVERRQVIRALRILPYRLHVRRDGRLDTELLGRQAMRRMSFAMSGYHTAIDAIAELEADANYFWAPTEDDVARLARALFSRMPTSDELQALLNVVLKPGVRIE